MQGFLYMNKIVYLDAAASFLKPESVISAEADFLRHNYANAGRGVCARAVAVDDMVRNVRRKVADFINADESNVVFVSNATDGLNRIVNIIARQPYFRESFVCAVSALEHHSARLPWEELARQHKISAIIEYALDDDCNIKLDSVPRADVLVVTAMSNVMGMPQDVAAVVRAARAKNPDVIVVVDATQYIVHRDIDVCAWDADFVVFSGHKIGADTGVGIMYIRDSKNLLPDKFGGGMVARVDDEKLVFNSAPEKWEAGTLPLTQICGLSVALDELKKSRPDLGLIKYIYDELKQIPRIKILTNRDAAVLSFIVEGMHVLDFGSLIGANGICLRVGNMCATWIHKLLNIDGSIRFSVGPWNTKADADEFISVVKKIVK